MRRAAGKKQRQDAARTNADAFAERRAAHDQGKAVEGADDMCGVVLPTAQTERIVEFVDEQFECLRHGFPSPSNIEIVESPDRASLLVVYRANTNRPVIVELVLRNPLRATIAAATLQDLANDISRAASDPFIKELRRDINCKLPVRKKWVVDLLDDLELYRAELQKAAAHLKGIQVELPLSEVVEGVVYAIRREEGTA